MLNFHSHLMNTFKKKQQNIYYTQKNIYFELRKSNNSINALKKT